MLFDAPYAVLWHSFLIYAKSPTAQIGLFLPLLLACAGVLLARGRRLPPMTGILFLVGLLLTAQFSVFLERDGIASLYCAPGCLLVMMLTPAPARPHWAQGYALCFLGEVTADLWCTVHHFLEQGPLQLNFYFGIGGGGVKDGLFVYPLMAALFLGADQWLRNTKRGELTVSEVFGALRSHIEANARKAA